MLKRTLAVSMAVLVSAVLSVSSGHAAIQDIRVDGGVFTPTVKSAAAGDTVKWTWYSAGHTVSGYAPDVFDSGGQNNGFVYTRAYSGSNVYYRCVYHSTLSGLGVPPSICGGMCGVVTDRTSSPAAPVITEPLTGAVDSDGYVDVRGTGEALTKVTIFEGATAIPDASALVKADGTFHLRIPFFTTGERTLTARLQQPTSSVPPSAFSEGVTVNVTGAATDTVAPKVYITMPLENGTFIYRGTPTVSGYATDNIGVTEVTFSLVPISPLLPTTNYVATCQGCSTAQKMVYWGRKPNQGERGQYDVYARTKDAAGNIGTAGPVTIYILGVTP